MEEEKKELEQKEPKQLDKVFAKLKKYKLFVKKYKIYFLLGIMIPIIAITFALVQQSQDLRQRAAGRKINITRIEINPSGFNTIIGKPVNMSTLAYDKKNNPIWSGVTYEWGISSTNSVGTLNPTSGSITTFTPQNNGHGDIYVTARTSNQELTYSIPVNVGPVTATPTISINCDLTNDGVINNKDYNLIRQCIRAKNNPSIDCSNADINNDGEVNTSDLNIYQTSCRSN